MTLVLQLILGRKAVGRLEAPTSVDSLIRVTEALPNLACGRPSEVLNKGCMRSRRACWFDTQ
jgi:hypothetical protein